MLERLRPKSVLRLVPVLAPMGEEQHAAMFMKLQHERINNHRWDLVTHILSSASQCESTVNGLYSRLSPSFMCVSSAAASYAAWRLTHPLTHASICASFVLVMRTSVATSARSGAAELGLAQALLVLHAKVRNSCCGTGVKEAAWLMVVVVWASYCKRHKQPLRGTMNQQRLASSALRSAFIGLLRLFGCGKTIRHSAGCSKPGPRRLLLLLVVVVVVVAAAWCSHSAADWCCSS